MPTGRGVRRRLTGVLTGTTMKRTRWTGRLVGGLLAMAALGGCKQQLFVEPADYAGALKAGSVVGKLEAAPHEALGPLTAAGPAPNTVLDPSRTPRLITLKEAIAFGLEQGNTGSGASNPGLVNDQLSQFTGRGASATDTIRAFALDPAIAAAEIERSLSKFDARLISSITWGKQDQPTLTLQQSFSNGDTANLTTTLAKPLPTGGVAGITFSTQYQNLSQPPPQNSGFVTLTSSYSPRVQFNFEQPLLAYFGVEINQLLPNHPGSQILNLRASGGTGSEGILITRIRQDQQRAQFDAQVNQLLLSVEAAYWNLYGAYYNLSAQEEGLKQALDSYVFFRTRAERGLNREQLALQALAQYWRFASAVIQARGRVLQQERNLRGVLNLKLDDGTRLVPIDNPTLVPYKADWNAIVSETLASRPELTIARQELHARQLDLVLQKNLRRPDLRFISQYDVAGLGRRLDNGATRDANGNFENALASLTSNQFNSWTLGLRLDMPIGFRDANASVRQSRLNMEATYLRLLDNETKAVNFLGETWRRIDESSELIRTRRAEREALEKQVRLDTEIRRTGTVSREEASSFILNLIQSQQALASATANEFQAIADYNIALASLEYAKGTIQRYNNVTVADGPLPDYVGKKATDHFAERDAALKLREHPAENALPARFAQPFMTDEQIRVGATTIGSDAPPAPQGSPVTPPALPGMGTPATPPKAPEATPAPRPIASMLPGSPGAPLPQMAPADAAVPANTFSPTGTVKLPTRPGATAPASTTPPVSSPVSTTVPK